MTRRRTDCYVTAIVSFVALGFCVTAGTALGGAGSQTKAEYCKTPGADPKVCKKASEGGAQKNPQKKAKDGGSQTRAEYCKTKGADPKVCSP